MSDLVKVKLKRVAGDDNRSFGVIVKDNFPLCVTLEDPWKDNKVGLSCIPAGTYKVVRVHSPHFGSVWQVLDVPGRTHILIHKGNTAQDTEGCILAGSRFGRLSGRPAVLASGAAYAVLEANLPDEFMLEVSA